MVNRRGVIKIGAAAMAGALVNVPGLRPPGFAHNAAPGRAHNTFQRAVFDERFAECRAFAAELHRVGVLTSAIRGDVADLWYGDLRGHLNNLSETRLSVAGLTDRAALFCLEELARDVGMRVIFRADHVIEKNGHARHTAFGSASLVTEVHNLTPEGFGRTMAGLFSRVDFNGFTVSGLTISGPGDTAAGKRTGPFSPENKTALVSWLIAS